MKSESVTYGYKLYKYIFQKLCDNCGIFDTKRYRYVFDHSGGDIYRLPISFLDTARVYDSWELVVGPKDFFLILVPEPYRSTII